MARDVSINLNTAITGSTLSPIFLIEMAFDSAPLRLWSGYGDLAWNGDTWTGTGHLLSITAIEETANIQANGVSFQLTGIPSELVSIALEEEYQSRVIKMYFAALDESGLIINDPIQIFSGRMDVMSIDEGAENSTITLTAESILADLERPKKRHYTPEDQAIDFPNDKAFDFVASLQDTEIIWGK